MNWDDFVASIRTDMSDNNAPPKYSDALLYNYFRSAIWDVSMYFPRRFDHVALEVDEVDPKKFALPAGFISAIVVECPGDNALSLKRDRPGYRRTPSISPMFYELDANTLYLDADPGGAPVLLSYYGAHGLPVVATGEDGKTTYTSGIQDEDGHSLPFVLTVPDRDIELVTLYVKALINQKERSKQSYLDRFKLGSGTREDNPIMPETTSCFSEYNHKLAERTGRTIFLTRPRKYRS